MSRNLSLNALWNDTDGIILPYVTILLVVIVGVSVLALDGGRYLSLQTQLQNGADQLALAASAELNGAPDSITRADAALATTLASFPQSTLFGTGANQDVTCPIPSCRRYLSALPPTDNIYPIPATLVTTDPLQARYIEVRVTPVTMSTILPASFFGGSNSVTAPAIAVAGFKQNVCKFTPMYVCNPYEPIGNTDYDAATQALFNNDVADPNALQHRQMISMRYSPGDFSQPGNYGFLVPPFGNGLGSAVVEAIANVNPATCYSQSGVDTQTGFGAQAIANAVNVRFDIYKGAMGGNKTDANYAPAHNVRKGYIGPACNSTLSSGSPPPAMGLPPDTGPSTSPAIPNIGNGNWDFDTYWSVEHPCDPVTGLCPPKPLVGGVAASNTNLPSRYSVLQYEIAQGTAPGGLNDASAGGEVGHPVCSSQIAPPDRRIMYNAIINCQVLSQPGGPLNGGKNTDIPVASFGKFFILKPVDPSTGGLDAEFVGLTKQGDGVVRNTFQLYR
jgi:Flp pilus assembly protein TadG